MPFPSHQRRGRQLEILPPHTELITPLFTVLLGPCRSPKFLPVVRRISIPLPCQNVSLLQARVGLTFHLCSTKIRQTSKEGPLGNLDFHAHLPITMHQPLALNVVPMVFTITLYNSVSCIFLFVCFIHNEKSSNISMFRMLRDKERKRIVKRTRNYETKQAKMK